MLIPREHNDRHPPQVNRASLNEMPTQRGERAASPLNRTACAYPSVVADLDQTAATLTTLRDALGAVRLPLDLPGVEPSRGIRTELADQIDDYLLPRIRRIDAPLLAVIGGSTGSGKSTITNSIARAEVSPSGVLRPTTRAPVLICNPDDEGWFAANDVLPELARVTGTAGTATGSTLRLRSIDSLRPGLAIIDAPDIDSIEEANRDLATQLLAAADLWLFVTTAVRYADAVPWEFLGRARERGTQLAVIINRVPQGAAVEIVPHLQTMLDEGGLPGVDIYPIEQSTLDANGQLDETSIADVRAMLTSLAEDAERRAEVVRATLAGALASVPNRAENIHASAVAQDQAVDALRVEMEAIYRRGRESVETELASGALLRGEVLDRWQELIGTAELMRAVQSRISWVRDRIGSFFRGRTAATNDVQGEITNTLEQLVLDQADRTALEVVDAWRIMPGGKQVITSADADPATGSNSLERASTQLRTSLAAEIRAWQDDVLALVADRGAGKRTTARVLAFGVNGIGVALMIVLFAQTGGVTGGEVAVASGTAAVSQGLLNALFGEQAVRDLAEEARRLLFERIGAAFDLDANRFRTQLWSAVDDPNASTTLRAAIDGLETE